MSKRLQVVLEEAELGRLQEAARGRGMTLAEWVRQTLRAAADREPHPDIERKLAAIRSASTHRFPAPDIEQMLEEIAAGYRGRDEE